MLVRLIAACCLTFICVTPSLHAQAHSTVDAEVPGPAANNNNQGPAGIVPSAKGFNLSLATISQHDSSQGWSSTLTPDGAYRYNTHLSADVSAPIYLYLTTELTGGTVAQPTQTPVTRHLTPGDVALNGHLQFSSLLGYELTATAGLPTGSKRLGIGAGQATYNFNNHFEQSYGRLTPAIELGIGDTSQFVDSRVRRSYTTVGPLALFQAGASIDLPRSLTFEADAYEELPLAAQTLYSTTGRGKKKVTTAIGKSQAEDNGFLTSLDIPLNPHTTLSGFYNRSLRSHIDTAGFALTFFLRATPRENSAR